MRVFNNDDTRWKQLAGDGVGLGGLEMEIFIIEGNIIIFFSIVDLEYFFVGFGDLCDEFFQVDIVAGSRYFPGDYLGFVVFLIFKKKSFFLHHNKKMNTFYLISDGFI